jgi:DNA-directed RNA polymerase sigma subunit (sigma70/sigma32)
MIRVMRERGMTLVQIAAALEITKQRVHQILTHSQQ